MFYLLQPERDISSMKQGSGGKSSFVQCPEDEAEVYSVYAFEKSDQSDSRLVKRCVRRVRAEEHIKALCKRPGNTFISSLKRNTIDDHR